jgi:hypothetical protein
MPWIKLQEGTDVVDVVSLAEPHPSKIDAFIAVDGAAFGGDRFANGVVIPAPKPDPLIAWREEASLSRLDFCTSLVRLNILTKDQALATIDGVWPEPMLSFLSFLDADQAFEVQMEWKAAVTVQRNHPFILSLGSWLELTTAQLDAMFGWVVA